ncbi:MAG TPA: FAD:protein FMN transferase [Terriglobia bacterium]|nr:FAD:protein FMN transferase [Terriglobia bacterium]
MSKALNAPLSLCALCVSVFLVTLCGCTKAPAAPRRHLVERTFASMGTELKLSAWTADEPSADAAFEAVFQEMERLEALLSNWRPTSDVEQLNAAAGKHPVRVAPELRELLNTSHQVSEWTGGKFDVTWGALSGLWKFDYQNKDNTIPDHAEIVRKRSLIDYRQVVVDDSAGTAFVKREGMVVNLGGIGKGYAVDHAREILRQRGFRDFMIQFGGDMYVAGLNDDHQWRLGIQDPRGPANRYFAEVDLTDSTFSTSGDYARSFIKNGRRYHHIIDPSTGEPAQGCRSVTIMTSSATMADGLDTGVFVLGPEAGMALVQKLPGVEAVIVTAKNEVLATPGIKGRLTVLSQPTDAP